ncbi:MAG: EI24 domain-containing protein [Candidatus Dactylopiibacterium sp.]|nr:EI24 domain-containing protein [Candidatus Dactylopiibacterium sp.]
MSSLLLACWRAFVSLLRAGMLWHLLWPTLLAAVFWLTLGGLYIGDLAAWARGALPGLPLVGAWFAGGSFAGAAAGGLLVVSLWLLLLPLIYATALLLLATVALPMMIERVGAREYPDLARRGGGSQWGSFATSLKAALVFAGLLACSLPLWLIPGAGLVITVLLSARLNRVCFAYDALMSHADALELRRVPHEYAGELNLLALMGGVMALVPVLNLFAPAWNGLAFVHFLLEALRRERARPLRDVATGEELAVLRDPT